MPSRCLASILTLLDQPASVLAAKIAAIAILAVGVPILFAKLLDWFDDGSNRP